MTRPPRDAMEQALARRLARDVELTASAVDLSAAAERFRHGRREIKRHRRQSWVVGVAAAAAAAVAIAVISDAAVRSLRSRHSGAAHSVDRRGSLTIGDLVLPPATFAAALHTVAGPVTVGPQAFGVIWATGIGGLYRLSPDGASVLTRTPLPGDGSTSVPVVAGDAIIVPLSQHSGGGVAVVDHNGHLRGTISARVAPLQAGALTQDSGSPVLVGEAAGDSTGAWLLTRADELSHLDVRSLTIDGRITLPGAQITMIATSGDSIYALDASLITSAPTVVRIEHHKVTARSAAILEGSLVFPTKGSVYVTGWGGLRRLDPVTLEAQAATLLPVGNNYCLPMLSATAGGELWVQARDGEVAQLDPATLRPIAAIRLFSFIRANDCTTITATPARVFIGNWNHAAVYSGSAN